jgi:hypothetical protein
MTSVLGFSWSGRTRRRHWFEKDSSRHNNVLEISGTETTELPNKADSFLHCLGMAFKTICKSAAAAGVWKT